MRINKSGGYTLPDIMTYYKNLLKRYNITIYKQIIPPKWNTETDPHIYY